MDEEEATYEFGPGGNAVYSATEYRFMAYKQIAVLEELERLGQRVPMWSRDVNTSGGRSYILQSYRAMWDELVATPPARRNFYEAIVDGWPVHPYFDYDMSPKMYEGDTAPSLSAALEEWCLHAKHVYEELRAAGTPGCTFEWDARMHWSRWQVMISNRKDKDSRHFIFKLPNNTMFASAGDFGSFNSAVLRRSIRAHKGDVASNPLLFVKDGGEVATMIDMGVYSRHRQYRTCYCTKMGNPDKGHLFPPGTTPETPPSYRDFLANLICYVPLTPLGTPVSVTTITVPFCGNPALKRYGGGGSAPSTPAGAGSGGRLLSYMQDRAAPTAPLFVKGAATTTASSVFADDDDNNDDDDADAAIEESVPAGKRARDGRLGGGGGGGAPPGEGGSAPPPTVDAIMEEVRRALERETRHACTLTVVGDAKGRGFGAEGGVIGTEKCLCPYAGREHVHKGNSLIYQVSLRYPAPRVVVWCRDPKCIEDVRAFPQMRRTHDLDMGKCPALREMLREYIEGSTIKRKMLQYK